MAAGKPKGVDDFDDKQAAALLCSMQTMASGQGSSGNGEKAVESSKSSNTSGSAAKPAEKAPANPAPTAAAPQPTNTPAQTAAAVAPPPATYATMGALPGTIPIYAGQIAFPYGVAGMASIGQPSPQWQAGFFARPGAIGLSRPEIAYIPPNFAGHLVRPGGFRMPAMLNGTFMAAGPTAFLPQAAGMMGIPSVGVMPVAKDTKYPSRRGNGSGSAKPDAAGSKDGKGAADGGNDSDEERKCFNCGDGETLRWRKSKDGDMLCNACGIYESVNNCPRPLRMKLRKKFKRTNRGGAAAGGRIGPEGATRSGYPVMPAPFPPADACSSRPIAMHDPASAAALTQAVKADATNQQPVPVNAAATSDIPKTEPLSQESSGLPLPPQSAPEADTAGAGVEQVSSATSKQYTAQVGEKMAHASVKDPPQLAPS